MVVTFFYVVKLCNKIIKIGMITEVKDLVNSHRVVYRAKKNGFDEIYFRYSSDRWVYVNNVFGTLVGVATEELTKLEREFRKYMKDNGLKYDK